jgi:hypothetical protein
MSNNIPVITQEEFEPKLLPQPKLTMSSFCQAHCQNAASNDPRGGKVSSNSPVPGFIQVRATNAKLWPNLIAKNKV